jgi:hypothetical protein
VDCDATRWWRSATVDLIVPTLKSLVSGLAMWLAALWWGSMTAVGFYVVPLLFATLPTPALAGNMAAKLFSAQTWVAVICGLMLLLNCRAIEPQAHKDSAPNSYLFYSVRYVFGHAFGVCSGAAHPGPGQPARVAQRGHGSLRASMGMCWCGSARPGTQETRGVRLMQAALRTALSLAGKCWATACRKATPAA